MSNGFYGISGETQIVTTTNTRVIDRYAAELITDFHDRELNFIGGFGTGNWDYATSWTDNAPGAYHANGAGTDPLTYFGSQPTAGKTYRIWLTLDSSLVTAGNIAYGGSSQAINGTVANVSMSFDFTATTNDYFTITPDNSAQYTVLGVVIREVAQKTVSADYFDANEDLIFESDNPSNIYAPTSIGGFSNPPQVVHPPETINSYGYNALRAYTSKDPNSHDTLNTLLIGASTVSFPNTFYFVVAFPSQNSAATPMPLASGFNSNSDPDSLSPRVVLRISDSGVGLYTAYDHSNADSLDLLFTSSTNIFYNPINTNIPIVVGMTYTTGEISAVAYVSTVEGSFAKYTATAPKGAFSLDSNFALFQAPSTGGGDKMHGDLLRMMVYSRPHNTYEMDKVLDMLRRKYQHKPVVADYTPLARTVDNGVSSQFGHGNGRTNTQFADSNNNIYFIGGSGSGSSGDGSFSPSGSNNFYSYNLVSNTWSTLPPYPPGVPTAKDGGILIGPYNDFGNEVLYYAVNNSLYVYVINPGFWASIGPISVFNAGTCYNVLISGTIAYIVSRTAMGPGGLYPLFSVDLDNSFASRTITNLGFTTHYGSPGFATDGNLIYLIGGATPGPDHFYISDVDVYDTNAQTITSYPSFPADITWSIAGAYNYPYIYAMGGSRFGTAFDDPTDRVYRYNTLDGAAGVWEKCKRLPVPLSSSNVVPSSGSAYLFYGSSDNRTGGNVIPFNINLNTIGDNNLITFNGGNTSAATNGAGTVTVNTYTLSPTVVDTFNGVTTSFIKTFTLVYDATFTGALTTNQNLFMNAFISFDLSQIELLNAHITLNTTVTSNLNNSASVAVQNGGTLYSASAVSLSHTVDIPLNSNQGKLYVRLNAGKVWPVASDTYHAHAEFTVVGTSLSAL